MFEVVLEGFLFALASILIFVVALKVAYPIAKRLTKTRDNLPQNYISTVIVLTALGLTAISALREQFSYLFGYQQIYSLVWGLIFLVILTPLVKKLFRLVHPDILKEHHEESKS